MTRPRCKGRMVSKACKTLRPACQAMLPPFLCKLTAKKQVNREVGARLAQQEQGLTNTAGRAVTGSRALTCFGRLRVGDLLRRWPYRAGCNLHGQLFAGSIVQLLWAKQDSRPLPGHHCVSTGLVILGVYAFGRAGRLTGRQTATQTCALTEIRMLSSRHACFAC